MSNHRFTIRFSATQNAIIDNKTGEVVGIPSQGGFFSCRGPSFGSKANRETTIALTQASNQAAEKKRNDLSAMAAKMSRLYAAGL